MLTFNVPGFKAPTSAASNTAESPLVDAVTCSKALLFGLKRSKGFTAAINSLTLVFISAIFSFSVSHNSRLFSIGLIFDFVSASLSFCINSPFYALAPPVPKLPIML